MTGVTTYASTTEGGATTTAAQAQIVVTSATRPETDTKNYVPYYYEMWHTADTDTYSETAQSVSYDATSKALTVATNTTPNRLKAGFNVTIAGATNFPQINGTWCVATATTTSLTFTIPNTLSGFTTNFSGTDTFTITYSLSPIYIKLEYWANIVTATNPPFVRIAFGGGTDGVGNLTGNRISSDQAAIGGAANQISSALITASAFPFIDLRSQTAANTSTIWRNIWSGANSRFGQVMWYNRNDTNAANGTQGSTLLDCGASQ